MLNTKEVFKTDFNNIKEVNNKYNSEKAILRSITIEHIEDDLNCEEMGIVAKAEINIPFIIYGYSKENERFEKQTNYKIQAISSGGLWGISENSDNEDLEEIEQEQISELMNYLKILNVATDLYEKVK